MPAPPAAVESRPAGRTVTWSPSVTLVPSRGCFNACGYCSFRLPLRPSDPFPGGLTPQQARERILQQPAAAEVLLLSGEVPPASAQRRRWFRRLIHFSALALEEGRLPHTNAGPLSLQEMAALARLNGSLGLMLEGLGPAYDRQHRDAPSKSLEVRIGQIEQAGRLGIPFTTGLLLGLGESEADRREALDLLAHLQRRWGHIQEVILQPWRPSADRLPLPQEAIRPLLRNIAQARSILPDSVHLQLPPNLWPLKALPEALAAGIDDLGGIDCRDVINPRYPQPTPQVLQRALGQAGWRLVPRLCVHREWIGWLPAGLRRRASALQGRLLASEAARA